MIQQRLPRNSPGDSTFLSRGSVPNSCAEAAGTGAGTLGASAAAPPPTHTHTLTQHPVKKLGRETTNWHLCLSCLGLKYIQEVRKLLRNLPHSHVFKGSPQCGQLCWHSRGWGSAEAWQQAHLPGCALRSRQPQPPEAPAVGEDGRLSLNCRAWSLSVDLQSLMRMRANPPLQMSSQRPPRCL